MPGTLKLSRLYEQQKDYVKSEQVLLKQTLQNRNAGFARLTISPKSDVYWLLANRDMESEACNFYKRVINLFPRDYSWQQKAGLFLYQRLAMAYAQLPIERYKSFTDTLEYYVYPWVIREQGEHKALPDSVVYTLPGTGERMVIDMPAYNPVKEALNWLLQSEQLSPDMQPTAAVAEAIADINSWLGNVDEAVRQYEDLLKRQPLNTKLRNKFINYLTANNDLSGAYIQLDTLYHQKAITKNQLLTLCEYAMLNGNYIRAQTLAAAYHPANDSAHYNKTILLAHMYSMQGNVEKALGYYKDSLSAFSIDSTNTDDWDIEAWKQKQNNLRLYAIARLYMLQGDKEKAFSYLKQSLDSGFNYKYVLDADTPWNTLRNSERWSALIATYSFTNYSPGVTEDFSPFVFYWIPDRHKQHP
jgi:tetratricopeptide (TPR) repeat protein